MYRTRAAIALGLVLCLTIFALAASACSGEEKAAGRLLAIDVVRAAPQRTMDASTARVELTVKFSGLPKNLGSTLDSTAEGELDFVNQRSHMKMDVGGLFDTEMIMDGYVFYMNMGGLLGDPAKPWIRADVADWVDVSRLQSSGNGASQNDPSQTLQWLRGMSNDVKSLGIETVRGVRTTHYRGTIDMTRAMEELTAALSDSAPAAIREAFERQQRTMPSSQTVDVWIDDDGLARRMRYTSSMGSDLPQLKGVKMETSIELFDFGKPVNISLPQPEEVQDFAAVLKAIETK